MGKHKPGGTRPHDRDTRPARHSAHRHLHDRRRSGNASVDSRPAEGQHGSSGSTRPSLTGSHAGSHRGERLSGIPDGHEQRAGTRPRSRTDLNGSGHPHMELRIRRSSLRPEGARVVAWLRSGDGPLSVRARPSSIKRDCDRRTTSTGEKRLVNVHAKSRLTPEPLRTLRSETKGQAGACPDRTRAIPCTVRAVTGQFPDGRAACDPRAIASG